MNDKTDFTLIKFREILECFLQQGYHFQALEDYINKPQSRVIILRHDVDRLPNNSLETAKLEKSMGIRGTYYFRIVKQSNDPEVIKSISGLGHEIGYHYEDLALAGGDLNNAYNLFCKNLEYFRQFYPVKTICMHGSPLSKWDNRDLWKQFSYTGHGIIAEPYFDLDFRDLLYLTDTGRSWKGERSSVRDKVDQENFEALKKKIITSRDLINSAKSGALPGKIMITVHPQRWTNDRAGWWKEYISQSVKNLVKEAFFVK